MPDGDYRKRVACCEQHPCREVFRAWVLVCFADGRKERGQIGQKIHSERDGRVMRERICKDGEERYAEAGVIELREPSAPHAQRQKHDRERQDAIKERERQRRGRADMDVQIERYESEYRPQQPAERMRLGRAARDRIYVRNVPYRKDDGGNYAESYVEIHEKDRPRIT